MCAHLFQSPILTFSCYQWDKKKGYSDFSISKAPLNFETDLCLKGVFSQNQAE